MKKLLFTIFTLCCTVSLCYGLNYRDEQEDIYFTKQGQLNTGNSRSINDIEATYNNTCLTINFNVSLGHTDIIIENESGNMAYNSSTNVNEHDVLFIPIGNLPSGIYYITIICDGGRAEGEFRIER